MKRIFSHMMLLCLVLALAFTSAACSPAPPDDMSPFSDKLSWGMTPEEVCTALDIDMAAGMEEGTVGANLSNLHIITDLPGVLGKTVPAFLDLSYAPQGLNTIRYAYSMDDLDAVKAALEKVYGPGRMTAYFDMAGRVIHSEKDPDDYATDFEPAIYRWDSEKTLGDRPDVIAFFDDPAQTGFPRELGYAAWAGEGLRSIELRLREGEDGGALILMQTAVREGYLRFYDGYLDAAEENGYDTFQDYYMPIIEAWEDDYVK